MTKPRHQLPALALALAAVVATGIGAGVLISPKSHVEPRALTAPAAEAPTYPTQATAPSTVPAATATSITSTSTAPAAIAAIPRTAKPGNIAFCGPNYDASPTEWAAVAAAGVALAYPPCSNYEFGKPVPWPVWDGTVRYMGFIPWNDPNVPHGLFEQYVHNATTAGVNVVGFAPEVWASADPGAVLDQLPRIPGIVSWALPEEPSEVSQLTAMVPMMGALRDRGLLVHLNFTATFKPEMAFALGMSPDLVSSDDYSSLDNALALDAMVAEAFPAIPRLAAVSTVQYDCGTPLLTPEQQTEWTDAFAARNLGVLIFTWNLPKLDQSCNGQDSGQPWIGGLWNAAADRSAAA